MKFAKSSSYKILSVILLFCHKQASIFLEKIIQKNHYNFMTKTRIFLILKFELIFDQLKSLEVFLSQGFTRSKLPSDKFLNSGIILHD